MAEPMTVAEFDKNNFGHYAPEMWGRIRQALVEREQYETAFCCMIGFIRNHGLLEAARDLFKTPEFLRRLFVKWAD